MPLTGPTAHRPPGRNECRHIKADDHSENRVADEVGAGVLGMQHSLNSFGRRSAHSSNEDARRGDE